MGVQLDDSLISLQCSLCDETYREPHLLACLHSFCFHCVKKLQRDNENHIKCPHCEQESCFTEGTIRLNYFYVNTLAASMLRKVQAGEIHCGNCETKKKEPAMFCEDCQDYLCTECVYCHENTKLTRNHVLLPRNNHEAKLSVHGLQRVVFCPTHGDTPVNQYCKSCSVTICSHCESHVGHIVVTIAEAYTPETNILKDVLDKAASQVDNHEKCASRCCSIVDELRACKRKLSEKIRTDFEIHREKVEKYEEQLQEMVRLWFDRNFEMIKQAQKEEEQRLEKIANALKLSQVVLQHGADVEILSLKNIIHSQLNRVANQSTGATLIAAMEGAIRRASWDRSTEHQGYQETSLQECLKLPDVQTLWDDEVNEKDHWLSGEWEILDESCVSVDSDWSNKQTTGNGWLKLKEIYRSKGKCGLEGQDYHVGSAIPGEKSKLWQQLRKALASGVGKDGQHIGRDYRYDKILRNRSIGRRGSARGEFHHPCAIAVDTIHDDRLIVTDFNNDRVQVFNYFGDFLFTFGSRGSGIGQFTGPTGVALLQNGCIVVCDCLNNRVQIFNSTGLYVSSFGQEGRANGEFWRPMGVAVDSKDRIIVVDQGNNRVQVFDSNGDFCFAFGKLGNWDGEISCPNFVAVDKDDNIYVSDEVNMRIQIFDRDGTYLRKISSQEVHGSRGNMQLLSGIAVDSRGCIVVGTKNSCSVQVFSPDGRFLRMFSSKRSGQSRLQFAAGIAITSAGEIVVSDWINNRIRFF